jgi:purine-binding chemotaxis protein CheW
LKRLVADAQGHLLFACGSSLYGVPADTASEVVNVPALTRVPGAPAHLLGVFAHRGEVLPVVDLSRLTGKPLEESARRAVVVRTPRGAVALTATKVLGVSQLAGSFDRLGETGVHQHLRGPAHAEQGEVAVIDTQTFVEFLASAG